MIKKILMALILAAMAAIPASAQLTGCQYTSGAWQLQKVRSTAVGSQIIGCINATFEAISSSVPLTSTTSVWDGSWMRVNRISGHATGQVGVQMSSYTWFTSSAAVTGGGGLAVTYGINASTAVFAAISAPTITSSATITGGGGLLVTYGVSAATASISGYAGIGGASNSSYKLYVYDTGSAYVRSTGGTWELSNGTENGGIAPQSGSGEKVAGLSLNAGNGYGLTMRGGTNVGDIAQAVYYDGSQYRSAWEFSRTVGFSTITFMKSGGMVGIGKAASAVGATLDVNGNAAFSSGITASSVTATAGRFLGAAFPQLTVGSVAGPYYYELGRDSDGSFYQKGSQNGYGFFRWGNVDYPTTMQLTAGGALSTLLGITASSMTSQGTLQVGSTNGTFILDGSLGYGMKVGGNGSSSYIGFYPPGGGSARSGYVGNVGGVMTVGAESTNINLTGGNVGVGNAAPGSLFTVSNDTLTVTSAGIVSAASQPGFSASTATVSIANDSFVSLVFETEIFDRQNSHAAGTFTVPAGGGGLYLINCYAGFALDATGVRAVRLVDGGVTTEYGRTQWAPLGGVPTYQTFTIVQSLSAGTTRKCQVYQNSGVAMNLVDGRMDAVKLW